MIVSRNMQRSLKKRGVIVMLKHVVHMVIAVLYRVKWMHDMDVVSLNAQLWNHYLSFKQFSV
jgi:hypothetical protein